MADKKYTLTELRSWSDQELMDKISEDQASLYRMRFNNAISQNDSPDSLKRMKRDIARLKTEWSARKLSK